MKEIGGFFQIESFKGREFYDDLYNFNYARNALEYLISVKQIKKIYLPYYLCELVYKKCSKVGIKIGFYHIDEGFKPILDNINLDKDEYIYIVNYYGLLSNEYILQIKLKFNNIILDNVHAFFQKPIQNIETIYSCRKFFGVPDGAYLATTEQLNQEFEKQNIIEDVIYMIGRMEKNANEYYSEFKKVSSKIETREIKHMSEYSKNILRVIDYNYVKLKRSENFYYLDSFLNSINKIHIPNNLEGPYMYPLFIENAQSIRKVLIENKIFIPLLWPNIDENNLNNNEVEFINNILPLPIDQRYSKEDMNIIIQLIRNEVEKDV